MDKPPPAQATSGVMNEVAASDPLTPALRVFRPDSAVVALGLAVNHLMTKPAFARQAFGDWARILVGQINRKHYCFAVDGKNVQGFAGWALVSREHAEAWVEGRRGLSYDDCVEGDCLIFNAWSANNFRVHRFMVDEARKIIRDRETIYFKRYYDDGTTRPVRLNVNDFVGVHVDRKSSRSRPAAGP
jgi:hemolysin-activating ACP:hemolysin acyltransferase